MNAPARKVPLHLRDQVKKADLVSENLRRLREQRETSEAAGSEPPPPPRTAIVDSRPVVLPQDPPPAVESPQPVLEEQYEQPPLEQDYQQPPAPLSNDELEQARAEIERLNQALNRSRQAQSADSIRANQLAQEVSRLQGQHSETSQRLSTLERERETQQASVVTEADIASRFSPEQRKVLGDDQCKSMIIAARTEASAAIERALKQKLAPLESKLDSFNASTRQSRSDAIFAALDANQQIKGWRQIDSNPEFSGVVVGGRVTQSGWLDITIEPRSGQPYRDVLSRAFALPRIPDAAAACAQVYLDYLATKPQTQPARTPRGAQPTTRPPAAGAGLPQRSSTAANKDLLTRPQADALTREFKLTRDPKRKQEITNMFAADARARASLAAEQR
jgi:hypothetical protein